MSSRPRRCAPVLSAVEVYITTVHREIIRLITRSHGADAPMDVAQDVVETLMGKVHDVMANYANPVTYARVAYRHATIQTGRRNRVQRGEGSRLHMTHNGTRAPGHQVLSGDDTGPYGGHSLFDGLADRSMALDDTVCDRVDTRRRLAEALSGLSDVERTAYFMVRGLGYPVAEVAATIGVRRETLQRRLGRVQAGLG